MSKLKLNEINFNDDELLVEIGADNSIIQVKQPKIQQADIEAQKKEKEIEEEAKKLIDEATFIINKARDEAQRIINDVNKEAQKIKDKINEELENIKPQKDEIIEKANIEAQNIIENARIASQNESNALIEKLKEGIEQERIETIKNAYSEGHSDGIQKAREELEEKITDFDKFCALQYEIRNKILKSANKDILDVILNITKKILHKEINAQSLDKIIKSTITLLEKKEDVNIILSEKYAKLLYEHQKAALDNGIEFNFEDFKQYENFNITYNPDLDDDTIIVENLKERFDASINSQLDIIVRDVFDNSQNGKIDLDQYENETE